MHGGDIFNNNVEYDFSVNINPYGPYDEVVNAVKNSISRLTVYPEYESESLRNLIAKSHGILQECVCVTNGASEAINVSINNPYISDVIIETPSFFGYEKSVNAEQQIHTYKRNSFLKLNENLIPENSILIIANPSNPAGEFTDIFKLQSLYKRVKAAGAILLIDESFLCLSDYRDKSFIDVIKEDRDYYDRVIVVRSFTKSFAIPALRLGYAVSSNERLINTLQSHLPEWNVSYPAQVAGIECIKLSDRLTEDYKRIRAERNSLAIRLKELGFLVYKSCANYILFMGSADLYEKLLEHKILIRDCSDYRGIDELIDTLVCESISLNDRYSRNPDSGIYRIAVKTKKENDILIDTIRKIIS